MMICTQDQFYVLLGVVALAVLALSVKTFKANPQPSVVAIPVRVRDNQ